MAKSLLLVLCFALVTTPGWGYSTPPTGTTEPPDVQTVAPTEDETLQNEADNQENVLSQVGCESHAHSFGPSDGKSLKTVPAEAFGGSCLSLHYRRGGLLLFIYQNILLTEETWVLLSKS